MDLQFLLHRKAELEKGRIDLATSWQIITGHIQECDHMITLLNTPKPDDDEIKDVEDIESSTELDVE
jgi:hypothetical protein